MKSSQHSLRKRLLTRLWIPLITLLLGGALASFGLAYHFGNTVHDRWLLDSAMTLGTQLHADTGRLTLELPQSAVEMFEWDSVDRIYEEVISPSGRRLFGNAVFPTAPAMLAPNEPQYYDSTIDGNPVRIVAIAVHSPADPAKTVTIQVAETKKKRESLVREIMLLVVPLQVLILVVAGAFIWFAVTSSLASLDSLAARIGEFEPENLVPLHDLDRAPSEVRPLILAINGLIKKVSDGRGAQQRFVANAAHQLRTPLAALQVQAERALRETDPDHHREALSHVLSAATRMRHLTQQMLTLTRSDPSSATMLAMTDIDLAALVRSEVERWADAAIARSIDLGYEGPESGPMVRGEPQLLRELIGNLVDNAIRYGRVHGEVTVGVRASPNALFVEDDGPGITPADRERVLEAFFRPAQSEGNGCGLGLSIAKEIAARHGAELRIGDRPPAGTRVEVLFRGEAASTVQSASVAASA